MPEQRLRQDRRRFKGSEVSVGRALLLEHLDSQERLLNSNYQTRIPRKEEDIVAKCSTDMAPPRMISRPIVGEESIPRNSTQNQGQREKSWWDTRRTLSCPIAVSGSTWVSLNSLYLWICKMSCESRSHALLFTIHRCVICFGRPEARFRFYARAYAGCW
jgi:hypothetical protein